MSDAKKHENEFIESVISDYHREYAMRVGRMYGGTETETTLALRVMARRAYGLATSGVRESQVGDPL